MSLILKQSSPRSFYLLVVVMEKQCFLWGGEKTNSQTQAVLQKLAVPLLAKQYSAFYGTQRLITVFKRSRHLSLSSARWIHSTPYHNTSLTYILTVSSHRSPGLQSRLFPSDSPATSLPMFLFSPTCATCPSHLILRDLITPNNIWWGVQIMKLHKKYEIHFKIQICVA